MNRRDFLLNTAVVAASCSGLSCVSHVNPQAVSRPRDRISFNTANLVGRVSGYRYELKNWGEQHQKTIKATDEAEWTRICADISKAGYRAVEIWEAHAAPETLDQGKARAWRRILDDHGLRPVAYGGGLRPETLRICEWLQIPHIDGGIRGLTPDAATQLCRQHGIRFNLENHPEKTVEEILKPIGGGNEWLGVCVDTGWLGTQNASAPAVVRSLQSLVRHVHVKDVRQPGAHETCRLGDGLVNIPATLIALREVGYQGWYSWEDEPEDRNPLDLAVWTRKYLEKQLG